MKISQLEKLLKEYPDDQTEKIKEKIARIKKSKLDKAKLENSQEFGILADEIKTLICAVKENKLKFPEEIRISNPVEVKEVTVNVPDEVKINNLDQIKYPSEIKVTNFPKQKEIKIPDKFEIKNTDKILEPLLKALQKEEYPLETVIERDTKGISRIIYIFKSYKLTVFITRDRNGMITNLRYIKE